MTSHLDRGHAKQLLLLAGLLGIGGAASLAFGQGAAPPPSPLRFESAPGGLREDVRRIATLLKLEITLGIDGTHRAHRARPRLALAAEEPNGLLNVLASAYGLRWITGPGEREVTLLDKSRYRGNPEALRTVIADALPADLRDGVVAPRTQRLRRVEGVLKQLPQDELGALEAATQGGPIALDRLPPEQGRPLIRYLDLFAAYQLGVACDRFATTVRTHPAVRFRYGPNPSGSRQFSFEFGQGRWLSVAPE